MDIKSLAEQAGIGFLADPDDSHYCGDGLQRLVTLAVAEERERCAAWCGVSESVGVAAHHIKAGTPAPK